MRVIVLFNPADSRVIGLWVGMKGPHTEILGRVSKGRKEVGEWQSAHLGPL